jgi:hypothetical protein
MKLWKPFPFLPRRFARSVIVQFRQRQIIAQIAAKS